MNKFPLVASEAPEKKSKEEQAEFAAYRIPSDDGNGELYLPGTAIQRALVAGAVFSKGRGRATLQKVVAACVLVTPEYIGLGTKKYAIDSRAVVVPATRGRIVRHRPLLPEWQAAFSIEYDENLLTEEQVRRVLDDTGRRVGLLDYRPAKTGPFGRFVITHWA